MRRLAPALALAGLLLAAAAPALAQDEIDRKRLKELTALCERYAKAHGDGAKLLVENELRTLPPLPANLVEPLSEAILTFEKKHGKKLKKSGTNYFYDKEKKRAGGLYMVKKGKKGGGLLIAMHGGGEGQGDAGGAFGVWAAASKHGFTVVAPEVMKKLSSAWNEAPEEEMVLEMIEAAKRTFGCDPDRICLAGHSMGGDGSWMIGGRNADLFAACSPLAGSVMPYMRNGTKNKLETPLSDYEGLMEGVLPNLMHVPYHIHHSDDDRNEAIHPDDIATKKLRRLQKLFPGRYEFTYDRVTGNGHALPKGGVGPIIKWMAGKRRVTYPTEVVWETWWNWKRQMYWLHHDEPEWASRFHARVVGANHVDVTFTSKPAPGRKEPKETRLTILMSPKMFDLDEPLKVTSGGKVLFEGKGVRSLGAMLVTLGRRYDPKQWFEASVTVTVPRLLWFDLWDGKPPTTPKTK
jgi:hypothetical protein